MSFWLGFLAPLAIGALLYLTHKWRWDQFVNGQHDVWSAYNDLLKKACRRVKA